ncbi:hypothetical protein BAOM_3654 [Peribacillus asahii]|uniref:Uncharacterized protein n=1 Tax=Peribacillus asahii TaxID=228899 RepID=A0A3T0KVI7_9BACI|nr:hypothetical protein BAOM_3654 [Peribacillus asahii]
MCLVRKVKISRNLEKNIIFHYFPKNKRYFVSIVEKKNKTNL